MFGYWRNVSILFDNSAFFLNKHKIMDKTENTTEAEYKYVEIEVTRTESTSVFLKVPKDWRYEWQRDKNMLVKAVKETVDTYDWDNYGWEHRIEVQSQSTVSEDVANDYTVFDVIKNENC